MGYTVTVFEKNEAAGGLLRYGIPNFKLNKAIIDRRISLLEAEGIEFKYNQNIDVSDNSQFSILNSQFDAIVIAFTSPSRCCLSRIVCWLVWSSVKMSALQPRARMCL